MISITSEFYTKSVSNLWLLTMLIKLSSNNRKEKKDNEESSDKWKQVIFITALTAIIKEWKKKMQGDFICLAFGYPLIQSSTHPVCHSWHWFWPTLFTSLSGIHSITCVVQQPKKDKVHLQRFLSNIYSPSKTIS